MTRAVIQPLTPWRRRSKSFTPMFWNAGLETPMDLPTEYGNDDFRDYDAACEQLWAISNRLCESVDDLMGGIQC